MHILSNINSSFLTVLEVQSSLSIHQRLALGPTPDTTKSVDIQFPAVAMCICCYSSTVQPIMKLEVLYVFTGEKNLCISVYFLQFKPLLTKVNCIQFFGCGIMTSSFVNSLNSPSFGPRSSFNHNWALISAFQFF